MGQLLSALTGIWATGRPSLAWSHRSLLPESCLRKPIHPPVQRLNPPEPNLPLLSRQSILQLPTDVLLLVRDHLDSPAALSLALTCRDAYAVFWAAGRYRRLAPAQRKQFLLLLERDPLGRGVVYCHPCNTLHPFDPSWGPRSPTEDGPPQHHRESRDTQDHNDKKTSRRPRHCGRKDRFAPIGNPLDLTYCHARLVMNRHLYGPAHGLPLANLCVAHTEPRDATTVHCTTAARILHDELYLRRTYAFTVTAAAAPEFRRCTGARDFRVCEHTSFFSNSSVYRQYIPELQRRPADDGAAADLVPCDRATGSCGLCLMDYDVTIAPCRPAADGEAWTVKIRAYHQLGQCRSPDDWKWARFSESSRPSLFFPSRPNRRSSTQYPGAVRKQWMSDDDDEEEERQQQQQPQQQTDRSLQHLQQKRPPQDERFEPSDRRFPLGMSAWLWQRAKPLAIKSVLTARRRSLW